MSEVDLSTPVPDAIAAPPAGWAWANADRLLDASISGGRLVASHVLDGKTSDLAGPRRNAARLTKAIDGAAVDLLARFLSPPDEEQRAAFLCVVDASEPRRNCRLVVRDGQLFFGNEAGQVMVGSLAGEKLPSVNLGPAGVWLRLAVLGDRAVASFSLEETPTPPTNTWVRLAADAFAGGPVLEAGVGCGIPEAKSTLSRGTRNRSGFEVAYLDARAAF